MERIKVHTFHSNGNDIVCKQMTAERVNEHILYISEDETYSNWSITYYYLIVEYNGIFVQLDRINSLEKITSITLDHIVENFKHRVEYNLYFNKVELILCKAISEELYVKALSSRNHVLTQRKEEEREREEKRKAEVQEKQREKELEKAQRLKERDEKKEQDEQFFKTNNDILKSDLSSFEKITAKSELTKIYRWNQLETGTNILCSILDLIRKYNYNKLSTRTERYTRNGELLKAPKTYYYIGLSENSLCYQIPAKLGKILTLKENKQ